jgi:hypothetical protein
MVSFSLATFGSYTTSSRTNVPSVTVRCADGTTVEPLPSSYKKDEYISSNAENTIYAKVLSVEETEKFWNNTTQTAKQSGTVDSTEVAAETEELNIGIFDAESNPYIGLSALLGLDGYYSDKTSLVDSLNTAIQKESNELTKLLDAAINEAKLGDVTKKLTFAEDDEGNIVVEGNISASKRKKLAAIINDDPELVERIKTQKARMEIADGLASEEVDFSKVKYDAARTQLLKNVLRETDSSLEDLEKARNELFQDGKLVQDE